MSADAEGRKNGRSSAGERRRSPTKQGEFVTDDEESVGGRPDPASFTPQGLHLTLGETEMGVCRINGQHGGSPAGLLLLSSSFLTGKDDKKAWSRQPAGTGQTRPWRGQDTVLPEGASVALATGASKHLPRDSPGSRGPGSFLVAQQYEDIKNQFISTNGPSASCFSSA